MSGPGLVEVRRMLSGSPGLSAAFEEIWPRLAAAGVAVAVRGGIAKGRVDDVSDLDFAVFVEPDRDIGEAERAVDAALAGAGEILCRFPASHVGLPHLLVYLLAGDHPDGPPVVKVDVALERTTGPGDAVQLLVAGDAARLGPPAPAVEPPLDVDLALNRATGWTWYTHTKIHRGELLEAERTLAFLRLMVLLPLLRAGHGLPQEDCRWLEQQLPAEPIALLGGTFPDRIEPVALRTALGTLVAAVTAAVRRLDPGGEHAAALGRLRSVAAAAGLAESAPV